MSDLRALMEVVTAPLEGDDLGGLLAQLEERGDAIAALGQHAEGASDEERATIRETLKQVLVRDRALVTAAQQAMGNVEAELASVKGGRDAVRGYRGAAPHGTGSVLSTA